MKYLKIINEDSSYNFYEDDDINTNTNLIKTNSRSSYQPYLFKGVKYFSNSKTYESNKKDLSVESIYSNLYLSNDNVPSRYIKELNGKLFGVSSSSTNIYNITDDFIISDYTDLTYYNGLYYLVKNTKEVYISSDLITFTLYKTFTSNINFARITNIGSQFFFAKSGSSVYANIIIYKAEEDDTTTRIENNQSDTLQYQNFVYSYDNYVIVLSDKRLCIFEYDSELNTITSYTSDGYSYPRNISLDYINNKILLAQKYEIIEFDFNTKTFSYFLSTNYGAIYLYHAIKLNDSGSNYSISHNGTVKNGVIYEELNTSYNITITANTNYVIDSVSSTNGTVNVIDDFTVQVVYSGDNLYEEDTLEVETSYALALDPKNYRLKETYTLTETFESIDTSLDNFAIVEDNGLNKIIPFKAIRFTDTLELKVNDTWTSFDKILYLSVSENIFGITNEFLTIFNSTFDYFYKGITSEYTTNLENLNVSLSGYLTDLVHIDYDEYAESEVDFYVAFMTNSSSKLYFNINVDEGYKIVSLETNVGDYTTLFGYRVEVAQSEMVQNLNAQFDITLDADDFKVILYKCTSESNAMNKYLSEPLELNCNLVEGTSVQNPSIIFELSLLPPDYNYAYIPIFKRYYFIGNKINIGFKLWRFNLDVDVLESAKNVIKNANAYVLRSSKYGSDYLFDELKPHYDTLTYNKLTLTNYRSFDFKPVSPSFNIIVVLRSTKSIKTKYNSELEVTTYPSDYITYGAWQENENGTDIKISDASVSDTSDLVFLATAKGWETLLNYLNEESLQSYIKNVIVYPYGDATNLFHSVDSSVDEFTINFDDTHSKVLSSSLVRRPLGLPKKLLFVTYDFDGLETKLYKQNYKYALYLPFFGYTELDKNKLVHSKLFVYYYLDLASGVSNVSLEVKKTNSTKATLLINQQCSLGIRIGFDIDNEAEVQKQRDMIQQQQTTNNITSALSLIGSLASVIGGAVATATGVGAGLGVAGIVGGISGLASSSTSIVSKNIQAEKQLANLFSTASSIIGTGNSSLYIDNEIALYEVTNEIVLNSDSETRFIARNGKPTKQYMNLSGLSGYFLLGDIDLSGLTNLTSGEISSLRNILYSGFYIK